MSSVSADERHITSQDINTLKKIHERKKLAFFPTPYPDELAFSIFERFHIWSGNLHLNSSLASLFGLEYIRPFAFLPHHLKWLIAKLPPKCLLTIDNFIRSYTFFPLFMPYLPLERIKRVMALMRGDENGAIYATLGSEASSIKWPKFLKYCWECVRSDEDLYGESYWHRSHQPFGVEVCHKHSVWLIESEKALFKISGQRVFTAMNSRSLPKGKSLRKSKKYYWIYKKIAEKIYWQLNNDNFLCSLNELREKYFFYSKKLGIANLWSIIDLKKLRARSADLYDKAFLLQMNSPIDNKANWLTNITRKSTILIHPIRHILFQMMLGIESEAFWTTKVADTPPFGSPPWPCLNPATTHFRKLVIENCKITLDKKTKKPIGHFTCNCGYEYSRIGPDKTSEDRFRMDRLISGGYVLCKKIMHLKKEGVNHREIALILGLNRQTVLNTIKKKETACVTTKKKELDLKRTAYRRDFTRILKRYPGINRVKLRGLASRSYDWLRVHDRNWLAHNMPPRILGPGFKWAPNILKLRDLQLSSKLKAAVKHFNRHQKSPIKMTRHLLFGLLGYQGNLPLDKLPRTKKLINSLIDTADDFHLRRLKYLIKEAKENGKPLSVFHLRTDVCGYSRCSSFLLKEIEKAVAESH